MVNQQDTGVTASAANPMGALLCPPEIAEAVRQSLAAWNALPDDERNGERPWIMGFNAGYEHARKQIIHMLRHELDDWPDYVAPADIADEIEGAGEWDGPLTAEETAMIDGAWEKHKASAPCDIPPAGWFCTRAPGHDGPCAAYPNAQVIP